MDNLILHSISVVIPIYGGEKTISRLIAEISTLTKPQKTKNLKISYVITEVILIHDCGPDGSAKVIEALCELYSFINPIWLTRNFGQHAASLAGMASAIGDWVVTIDEDGQQNPLDIQLLLEEAISKSLQLVYARPINKPPHGWFRNCMSRLAKFIGAKMIGYHGLSKFNSFRLIEGEIARTLAAYCGYGIYLDVGLFWIADRVGDCGVILRPETQRVSGYTYIKLLLHFWNLTLTTGVRPLRLITTMGLLSIVLSLFIFIYALYGKYYTSTPVQGWASLLIIVSFFSGSILTGLGIIAEYMAIGIGISMGRPLYVVKSKLTK